jgi:hypothetical protein
MANDNIELELLPWERAVLMQWILIPEVRSQLQKVASSDRVESIILASTILHWLASDLTHAIVKKGCRDDLVFELSERLDYVDDTHDGSLDSWY